MATVALRQLQASFHCLLSHKEKWPPSFQSPLAPQGQPKGRMGQGGEQGGGVEAAEEWEMRGKRWLFGWKTKRLFKALALRPACPSVLLWGGSAPRSSWACGQLYAKLRPLGGKTDLEQQCCTEVVGGFLL